MTTPVLPRPGPPRWRSQAAASQRDRLLAAAADVVIARGYANSRVADVIARAGVSRRTFYEYFRDLEDCVLAAYDRGVDVLVDELRDVLTSQDSAEWTERLAALLHRYLEVLASEPVFAQLALVEVLGVGHAARERYLLAVDRFHGLLREIDRLAGRQHRERPPANDATISVLAGGLNRLVMTEVLAGRGHALMDRYDELLAIGVAMLTVPPSPPPSRQKPLTPTRSTGTEERR